MGKGSSWGTSESWTDQEYKTRMRYNDRVKQGYASPSYGNLGKGKNPKPPSEAIGQRDVPF